MDKAMTVAQQVDRQKLQTLNGERGDPLDYALRRRNLEEVQILIGTVKRDAALIAARLTASETDLATLIADIAAIEAEVAGLTTDLAGASADLASLTTTIAGIEASIADLADIRADLSAAEARIATLRANMLAVSVPALTSSNAAGAAPTAAEFNRVVADLTAMRTAILALRNAAT